MSDQNDVEDHLEKKFSLTQTAYVLTQHVIYNAAKEHRYFTKAFS